MKRFIICGIIIAVAVSPLRAEPLRIHVPRTIDIGSESILLGKIAILGGDGELAAKAQNIVLGKILSPGQKIVIDRNTIMSMLASAGIDRQQFIITGSESIVVKRQGCPVTSQEMIKCGAEFLKSHIKDAPACRWSPAWQPKEVMVDGDRAAVRLVPKMEQSASANQSRVIVSILLDGKEIARRECVFNQQYLCRRAVATADIRQGSLLTSDNVRIETYESSTQQQDFVEPLGLAARRQIRLDTVITPDMFEAVKSPLVVTRSQGVVIQVKQPGLSITAMGEAMQDGRANEYIKVRNVDSQKTLLARVNQDGTVEPIY
jgi:flagella basal body P-ring formation protein FlgA